WFEALCPEHRYFAISSAGLSTGAVDPINVSEVLDWVVERDRAPPMARPRPNVAIVRNPGVAVRTGVLALAGLAGFGTYSLFHRAPATTRASSGEVRASLDTIAARAR